MLQQQEISSILTGSGSIYFIRLDLKSNFLFVNDLFRKIFGIDVSGQKKISFFDFLSIEDVEPFAETVQYIAEKHEPLHIDLRSLRYDGSLFWTRWEFFPIVENDELQYFEGVGIDITERKRAEEEKVFAKKSLQLILDNTEEGFVVISPELKVISYNNRANEFNLKFTGKPLRQGNNIHEYLVNRSLLNSVIDAALSGKSHQLFIEVPDEEENYTFQFTIRPIYNEKNQSYGLILTSRNVTEAKRAEQLLLDSEEKYRFLFFSNPQPMWVFDQETLQILEVNDVAVQKYGYSRDEFLSMTIRDIRPAEEIPTMLERVNRMMRDSGISSNEHIWRHKKKNGEIIFVEIKSHSILFNGRKGFLISVNDITRLIEAEKSLAISNERFKLASQATSDAIWDVDFVSNTLHWGEGYERLFGYKLDNRQLNADTWLGHIHADDYEEVRSSYEKALEDPNKFKWLHEYRYIRSDRSIAYVRDRGIIIRNDKGIATRMIGALQDITESKKYEENLFRERNLLRTIIDTIPDRIFVKDKNFRHLINNRAMVTILGASSESETLGKTMVDYYGPDAQGYLDKYDRKVIEEGTIIEIKEDKVQMPDGKVYWINTTLVPLIHNGEIIGLVGTSKDITDRKEIEESLRHSNEVFQMVSWATNDAIFDYDMKNEKVTWNEAFVTTFGYENPQTNLAWWATRMRPADWRKVERNLERTIKNKEPHYNEEMRFMDVNGNFRSILCRAVLLYDENDIPRRMIGSITDLTEMKKLQTQLERERIKQQRTITEVTIRAQEKERIEIGRELHDNINQILTTTKLYIDVAMHEEDLLQEMLQRSMNNISSAIDEIRYLSRSLVPPSLGDIGVEEAIIEMISNLRMSKGILFEFSQDGLNSIDLAPDLKLMVFRIVQEQVNNILKHSKASRAEIKLSVTEKMLNITIEDNGIGFDTMKRAPGIGLNNIVGRAELHNGTVDVVSSPGNGCTLKVSIPVN